MSAIGIDIGGTNLKAVRVDGAGAISDRSHRSTPRDRDGLVAAVRELVEKLAGCGGDVGVSSPGLANRDNYSIRWMRGRLDFVEGLDY